MFTIITVKNVYNDGVRICVAWVTRVFSRIRAGRSLYEQITGGYFAFLGDHAHPASGRVVIYFLKLSQGLMEDNHDKLTAIVCILYNGIYNTSRYTLIWIYYYLSCGI